MRVVALYDIHANLPALEAGWPHATALVHVTDYLQTERLAARCIFKWPPEADMFAASTYVSFGSVVPPR